MNVFDANVGLGRFAGSTAPFFATASDLLSSMDRLGISESLAYSVLARECGLESANEGLVHETAKHPRLHACPTLIPADPCYNSVHFMRNNGLTCGRIFPRSGHFSVRPWCLEAMAEDLLTLPSAVLFIDFELTGWGDESIDWAGIRDLCLCYPKLPIVVCGCTVTAPRLYDRLLQECGNLYIEISRLHVPGELERLCANGFASRVLFGSDGPTQFAGGPLSQIHHANLNKSDLANILGGNLSRLLNLSSPSLHLTSTLTAPNAKTIDMHVHYGRWHHSVCGLGDANGIVEEMDRCRLSKAVLTSIFSCYGDVQTGNTAVADACQRHPTRLFGYITVDPKHPAEMKSELKRHGANPSFRGIKFHCGTHVVRLNDTRYTPALEYANEREWPVLIHEGMGNPDPWVRQCERYPNATLIAAHAGGMTMNEGWEGPFLKMCRTHKNLTLDLAASRMVPDVLEQLVEAVGAERIVYGSDYPIFDFGYARGRVDFSTLSEPDKSKILFENAARLLQIEA